MDLNKAKEQALIAKADIELAREAYQAFQEAWANVGRTVKPLDLQTWYRVDAYPGWNGTRDVGAGTNMLGWMEEVEATLQDVLDTEE